MRFHLDEHVHPAIAHGLRRRGIDVTTTNEVGLRSAPDESHIEHALQQGRVIFTNDSDFLAIHHLGIEHAGIVYCHRSARTIGEIIHYLFLMHHCMADDEMRGAVQYL
jgi:predicted nuclease of predicted toxin-antitoxin system